MLEMPHLFNQYIFSLLLKSFVPVTCYKFAIDIAIGHAQLSVDMVELILTNLFDGTSKIVF